jgi:hypothetical protein
MPIMVMSLTRHFGSSSTCVRSDALDDRLERPESIDDDGEEERGECA